MLNITDRTVRKAKEELREAGYLSWKSHGGLHITADYRFNFKNLLAACDKIEQDASMLVGKRRRGSDRNNSSGMEEGVETGNLKPETGNFVP